MLKKIIDTISNPLLFYADKSGNAVFRNFCWFKNTGCLYKMNLTKAEVGKILECRFELEKYLKAAYFIVPIVIYLIFIHLNFSLLNMLICEFWWITIICGIKCVCAYMYSKILIHNFGMYEVVDFKPHIPREKTLDYRANFYSKIVLILVLIALFFAPAFGLLYGMKLNLNSKKTHYTSAITLSKVYLALYPKTESVYDMRAFARYKKRDYEGALKDYKTVLKMSGKKFTKKDFTRFANLLLLERKLTTAENAVDVFNEYATRKKMSILEEEQMLWIKSIFRVENNIIESIIPDYNDLLESLDKKDKINYFYISSDKAYILYLMQNYDYAIEIYNVLISYATAHPEKFAKELQSLYAERGYAKRKMQDQLGADADFVKSKIDPFELDKYEPRYSHQEFVAEKF